MQHSRVRVAGTDVNALALVEVVVAADIGFAVGADEGEVGLTAGAVVVGRANTGGAGGVAGGADAAIRIVANFANTLVNIKDSKNR